MCYIPFTDGKKFLVETNGSRTLFQATADFEDYLQGINDMELQIFLLDKKKEKSQYRKEYVYEADGVTRVRVLNTAGEEEDKYEAIPCRRVGDVEKANNNAGNWE